MPVLDTIGIEHGPHIQALKEPAPGDVLGQFLDRNAGLGCARTLDWLSTSLLKGMSREGDGRRFWAAFAIRSSPRRAPEATLPISLPVTPSNRPSLFLSNILWLPRADLTAVKS